MREFSFSSSSFLCDFSVLEVPTPLTRHGAADRLHPCVERGDPVLIDLSYHRGLPRSQLTRYLVKEIGADADIDQVADTSQHHAGSHPDNDAGRPAEHADQGANQTA